MNAIKYCLQQPSPDFTIYIAGYCTLKPAIKNHHGNVNIENDIKNWIKRLNLDKTIQEKTLVKTDFMIILA